MKTTFLKITIVIIITIFTSYSSVWAQDSSKTKSEHKNKMEIKHDHKNMDMKDNKAMMDSCKMGNKTEMPDKCKK